MRVLVAFLIGAALAGTVVYYAANREEKVQVANPQPVRKEIAPPVVEAAQSPIPAINTEQPPPVVPKSSRKAKPFRLELESTASPTCSQSFPSPRRCMLLSCPPHRWMLLFQRHLRT